MNVRILGFSEQHLIEGSRFYEEQAAGLGTYFSMLCLPTSTHWHFTEASIRSSSDTIAALPSGSFAIYYLVAGDEIRVYAVLDCRRRPSWVRSQLKRI